MANQQILTCTIDGTGYVEIRCVVSAFRDPYQWGQVLATVIKEIGRQAAEAYTVKGQDAGEATIRARIWAGLTERLAESDEPGGGN